MPASLARKLIENVSQAVLGKQREIELTVATLFAGGHLLIEDRPGVGKTLLARALARSMDLPFQRLQCTADLLPSDIIGGQIYQPNQGELTFRRGPVFTSVLVADELNRTPPRTQSALLECMAEGRISVDRETYDLPKPFFVIATQNPLNFSGTYPLPESQLDRFLMRIQLGYPEPAQEIEIVSREDGHRSIDRIEPVASTEELMRVQNTVQEVRMQEDLVAYIIAIAQRTRDSSDIQLGVSPRGAQALHRACRARSLVEGRDYVVPDDIRSLALPVFSHRISVRGGIEAADAILTDILNSVPSPD